MAAKVTREDIEQYKQLDDARKTVQREADNKERAAKPLKAKLKAYVENHGGKKRATTHFGYVLSLVPWQKKQVGWKDEFIALAGDERAGELQEAQPMLYSLSVEPVAADGTP